MKLAETVTFGGSGLDRAGALRGDVESARAQPSARTMLLWRGKIMVEDDSVVTVPMDHPVLSDSHAEILVGQDETGPIFANDLSRWTPDNLDQSQLGGFIDTTRQFHPALPETHGFAELRALLTILSPRDAELSATAKANFDWHRIHGFCANCGAETQMAMAGWERHCDACGRKHFPRTDPVVIMLVTHGNDVLIGRSPGWPEGMYSLLAGFIEPGETMEAAVRRETFEETGVEVGPVSYLASQPWPFPASLMFGCHGLATSKDITIDPNEIEDALWLSREQMADVFAGNHPKVTPARPGAIAHFLLKHWLADTLD